MTPSDPIAADAPDLRRVLAHEFADVEHRYDERDAITYALGIGLGGNPTHEGELRFVYEKNLRVFPTFATVLCPPGPWMEDPRYGINRRLSVHGAQRIEWHKPLPASGHIVGKHRTVGVVDKGPGRGALVHVQRQIFEKGSAQPSVTLLHTSFARANGGFGGSSEPVAVFATLPPHPGEATVEMKTHPAQALHYRLNGDRNPLHADPATARAAGFERPILHGLCSFGIAGHALMVLRDNYEGDALASLECRFSAPVYPGETLAFEFWREAGGVLFRATTKERGLTVLDNGRAVFN
ncbi:MAG: MaoC/PaaZ C-terminal domain-containing protein [Pseudomonadota bacterium]